MSFFRTWNHTKINQLASTFDGVSDNSRMQHWGLTAVTSLVAAQGVTVWKSSNSISVSVGSSNLTTLGSFVADTNGNPHSWIVLTFANGGQLLLTFDAALAMDGFVSPTGTFSGGDASNDPSAPDSAPFDSSFSFNSSGGTGDDVVHVLWTTDGAYVLLFWTVRVDPNPYATFFDHIWVISRDDAADVSVPQAWMGGGHQFQLSLFATDGPATVFQGQVESERHLGYQDPATGDGFNGGKFGLWSIGIYESGQGFGFAGRVRDVYTAGEIGDAGHVLGQVLVVPGGDRYAKLVPSSNAFVVPWDGSAVRLGASPPVDVPVSAFIVPTQSAVASSIVFSNMAPPPGSSIDPSTFIQFDVTSVTPLALIVPTIAVDPNVAPEVVHDWTSGEFSEAYAKNSTRAVIANGFRYRMRRLNGWAAPPVLRVWAVDSAGNVVVL